MQTTVYDIGGLPQGTPGQLFDISDAVIDSVVNAEASAAIPPGVMVKKGTADNDAKLPAASNDLLIGIAVKAFTVPKDFGSFTQGMSATGMDPGVTFGVLKEGRCWVVTEQDVTPADPAFVRFTANGAGKLQLGAFRKDADTTSSVDYAVTVAGQVKFLKAGSAAGLVPVSIDMTNKP